MVHHVPVVVLGLGAMGTAALVAVAERGVRALGIERFALGHSRGASHGESRIIRKAYFEHPDYVPLLETAYEGWRRLQESSPAAIFHDRVGLLTCGPPDGVVAGVRAAAAAHSLPLEDVSAADVAARWALKVPAGFEAVLDPLGGILRPEACVHAQARRARDLGALTWEGTAVESHERDGDVFVLRTSRGPVSCDRLVVTAGPWSSRVLEELGLPIALVRKVFFWHRSESAGRFDLGRFPTFFLDLPYGRVYGFPDLGTGVKIADHLGGQPMARPEDVTQFLLPGDAASCRRAVVECLPELSPTASRHQTCVYAMTPDENFIVDRHPDDEGIAFAAGFSGHGFKFAPVIGEALADLALEGRTGHPIGFLSLARFPQR